MSDIVLFSTNDAARPGIGGPIDRASLTLAIYGEDLVPEEISQRIGLDATRSFRKGEKSGRAAERGGWCYAIDTVSPHGPEQLLQQFFQALGGAGVVALTGLSRKYEVQLSFVLRMEGYNRGFEISPASAQRIASIGASVGFSIYAEE